MSKYKGRFESGQEPREKSRPQNHEYHAEPAPAYEPQPVKKKKKMSTPVKIVLIALLVIVILAAAVLVFANHMLNKLDRTEYTGDPNVSYADLLGDDALQNMDADSAQTMQQADEAFESLKGMDLLEDDKNIVNYLIIGTDRRDTGYMGNSDTMIVMSLNKNTKKIHLTSLMRAMYVAIPQSSGTSNGMLNWAYSMGGPELLIDTIEQNFKIHIDHYAAVDFTSFEEIVDAIGGVSITLSSAEAAWINEATGSAGCYEGTQILTGQQALWYSRCRSIGNDFVRTSRQRNVIESIIHSVGSLSVTQLTELANVVLPAINTDMTNTEILAEVINVPEYASYPIDQMMLPIENQDGEHYIGIINVGGHEMYSVDWNTNLPALQDFIQS